MLIKFSKLPVNSRGDTIVEVLIAIAIISLVLAGAFVTTNNSVQRDRDSQERVNATKIAEMQVELIKSISSSNAPALIKASNPFCISNGSIATGKAACTFTSDGSPNPTLIEPAFQVDIVRNGSTYPITFTVKSQWYSLADRSSTFSNVQLEYRSYD